MEEILLVQKLKEKDQSSFVLLYEKYGNILLRMAFLVSGNLDDAEDIVQETFVKCYLHIGDLKNEAGFRAWLFQILYRTAYYQKKKRKRELPDDEIAKRKDRTDNVTSLDRLIRTEEEKQVRDAIQGLNFKLRTVVILYYYNEMSTKEISKVLECSESAVKSRLFTARKKLRSRLEVCQEGSVII